MSSSQQVGGKPAAIAHKEPTPVQGKPEAVQQGKPAAVQQGDPAAAQQQYDHFISGSSTTHTHPHHHHHHHHHNQGTSSALQHPHAQQQASVGQQEQLPPPALAPEQQAQLAPEQKPAAVAQKPAAVAHKEHTIAPVGQQQQDAHEHVQQGQEEHEQVAQSLSQLGLGQQQDQSTLVGQHAQQDQSALVGQHEQGALVGQHDQSAAAAQGAGAAQSALQTIKLDEHQAREIYQAYRDQRETLSHATAAPTTGEVAKDVVKSAAGVHPTYNFFFPNGLGDGKNVEVYVQVVPSHLQTGAHTVVYGPLTVSI